MRAGNVSLGEKWRGTIMIYGGMARESTFDWENKSCA